jgi:hypothetical protein
VLALSLTACGGDGEEPVADVGRIACSGTSLAIDTPKIRTQTDGVHLNLRVSDERGVSLFVDGEHVRGEVVMSLPPGGVPREVHPRHRRVDGVLVRGSRRG